MDKPLVWEALEYEHRPKSVDWFWMLGTISALCAFLAIYFGNTLFGVMIIVAGVAIGLHANIPPKSHTYIINNEGILKDDLLYPFRNIKTFFLSKDFSGPIILLEIDRTFMPIVTLPLGTADKEWVRQIMRVKGIRESELTVPFAERLMDMVGF